MVPVATGMALFLCLSALKKERPEGKYVIWCRCDQNSAIKAVALASLELVTVSGIVAAGSDEIATDVEGIRRAIVERGAGNVCCVLSTTSCFAPRGCDDVEAIARTCQELGVAHLINHAYGLQCARSTKLLARAARVGRVDAYVSSTDKNFQVQ